MTNLDVGVKKALVLYRVAQGDSPSTAETKATTALAGACAHVKARVAVRLQEEVPEYSTKKLHEVTSMRKAFHDLKAWAQSNVP
jgi:hypothetical protein